MTKINVEGRRLVKENKIAQIGQTGPEYTAGEGITITEGEISVDNTVVATKTDVSGAIEDLNDDYAMFEIEEYFPDFSDCTIDTSDNTLDISNIINDMPILISSLTTDYEQLPNPKFDTPDRDDNATKAFYFRGMCLMKDTVNNTYVIFSTVQSLNPKWGEEYDYSTYRSIRKLFSRTGTDNFYVSEVRPNRFDQIYFSDATASVDNLKINGVVVPKANVRIIRFAPTENACIYINPRLGYQGEMAQITFNYGNANAGLINTSNNFVNQIRVPATEGSYLLKATVNANGLLDKFEWVSESDYKNVE